MSHHVVPIAVVGASWRTAPTTTRAQLAQLPVDGEVFSQLKESGYLEAAACLSTCSRTEWVLSAKDPEWAATLFRGALTTAVPELTGEQLHVRSGQAAVHYLLRVAVGLDSVAEGEGAVGRQVLKAFDSARAAGHTDRHLRQLWKHVERIIHDRRDTVPSTTSRGLQSLVRDTLREHEVGTVAVLGRGEFGLAMERALRAATNFEVSTFSRQSMHELFAKQHAYDAVVVCTGGPAPWLELPHRRKKGLCIDAGSPPQVLAAPGWQQVGLDSLLSRPSATLPDEERERLEALVRDATHALSSTLSRPSQSSTLALIDAERTAFLNEQLPALLAGLPPKQIRRVRQAVGAFTHTILQRTREVSS